MSAVSKPLLKTLLVVAIGPNGTVKDIEDLSDQFLTCTLTSSIFSNAVNLDISLSESKGALTKFNKIGYQGQEFVLLEFTEGTDKELENLLSMQFWVYSVEGISIDSSMQSSSMVLRCKTKESLISLNEPVNKAFDSTYSQSIRNIFSSKIQNSLMMKNVFQKNYNKKEVSFTAPTYKGPYGPNLQKQKFIIPGLSAFAAIKFCSDRSYNEMGFDESHGQMYVFYAGWNHEFHYKSVEDMVTIKETTPLHMSAQPDPPQNTGNARGKILKFDQLQLPDQEFNIAVGVYNNKVRSVDYYGKTYRDHHFALKNKNADGGFKALGDADVLDKDWLNMFNNNVNHTEVFFKDTTKPYAPQSQNFDYGHPLKRFYAASLFNLRSSAYLDGRCDLHAGGLVDVALPEASAAEDFGARAKSKFGGKWLIESVTHVLTQETLQTKLALLKHKPTRALSGDQDAGP